MLCGPLWCAGAGVGPGSGDTGALLVIQPMKKAEYVVQQNMVLAHTNLSFCLIIGQIKANFLPLWKSLGFQLDVDLAVGFVLPYDQLPSQSKAWEKRVPSEEVKQAIINRTALKRKGHPIDIANTTWFLIQSDYITGQIINVDGGRTLSN